VHQILKIYRKGLSPREKSIVCLFLDTGMSVSDIAHLFESNVWKHKDCVYLWRTNNPARESAYIREETKSAFNGAIFGHGTRPSMMALCSRESRYAKSLLALEQPPKSCESSLHESIYARAGTLKHWQCA
jgi:hypothetical protein